MTTVCWRARVAAVLALGLQVGQVRCQNPLPPTLDGSIGAGPNVGFSDNRALGRPEENGPLNFHPGTEAEMLQSVRSAFDAAQQTAPNGLVAEPAEVVLSAIDDFCWHRHWMMNIGDVKGRFLDEAMRDQLVRPGTPPGKKFRALELGGYVGYSAVRVGRLLPPGALLYSVDVDPTTQRIAQMVAEMAGVSSSVEFLSETAQEAIKMLWLRDIPLDFILLDHDKKDYLPALQRLEKSGLMMPGTTVVADNVGVFHIDDYLEHVRTSGLYRSRYVNTSLEYTPAGPNGMPEMVDGVEISIYEPTGVYRYRWEDTPEPQPLPAVPVLPLPAAEGSAVWPPLEGSEQPAPSNEESGSTRHLPEKAVLLLGTAGAVFAVYHLLGGSGPVEPGDARMVRQPLRRSPGEAPNEEEEEEGGPAQDAAE